MLLKANDDCMELDFVVGVTWAVELCMSGPCSTLSMNVMLDRSFEASLEALKDFGERRKSKDHDFWACDTEVGEPFSSNCVKRLDALGSIVTSEGKRAESMGSKYTEGRLKSSRTSLMVKEA